MKRSLSSLEGKKIWLTGHTGLVGSSLLPQLEKENCKILSVHSESLDLRDQNMVLDWASENRPDAIISAAATVGGIAANIARPFDFIYDNLMMNLNLVHCANTFNMSAVYFIGSNCMYPSDARQPYKEICLFEGEAEPTNKYYAEAKRVSLLLLEALEKQHHMTLHNIIPTSLYGPNVNFSVTE